MVQGALWPKRSDGAGRDRWCKERRGDAFLVRLMAVSANVPRVVHSLLCEGIGLESHKEPLERRVHMGVVDLHDPRGIPVMV